MITTEYTDLLAVLPEPYLLISGAGQILVANDRAAALLGRDPGALVGSAIFDLVEEPREAVSARLQEWSAARAPTSATLALRGDAQPVWCDAAVVRPVTPDRSASILLRLRRASAAGPRFAPLDAQLDELYREVDERRRSAAALRDATERLTLALDAGRMGTWEWDISTNAVVWSETLERIHGLQPGSFPGTFDAFASGIHPSDLERVLETISRTVREARRSYRISYRMRRPDGEVRVLHAQGRLIMDWRGEPVRMIGVCTDDTDRTAAEERERLLAAAGAVLSAAAEPEQALAEVAHLATGLLADTCAAYLREGDALRLVTVANANPEHASLVAALTALGPIRIDEDHALAHVVRTGETIFVPDISDAHFERLDAADERTRIWRALEPRSTIVAPVVVRGEAVGALALATLAGGKRRLTRRDVPATEELARRIAAAVELGRLVAGLRREVDARRRNEVQLERQASRLRDVTAELEARLAELQAAHRELAEAERRARFLAAAGQALASSLDYETTLRTIAELAVPEIADWCAVDLREGDEIRRVAIAHADPGRRRAAEELVRHMPPRIDAPTGIGAVIRTGQPQLYGEVDIADVEHTVRDTEEARLLRLIGLRSAILVPLELRGECIGGLTLAQGESGRRFDQDDITFALDLAHHAATAIENARLFKRAQDALHARDDVLAVVSHDLRNPIALIETGVRTLLDPSLPEERRRAVLGSALRATGQANRLIDDLLDIARSEAGRLFLNRSPLSPGTAVDDVIDAFRGAAEEAGIALRAEVNPDLPPVRADPARLHRVLTNLLANALRFTPRGGRVVLSAASDDPSEVVFTVADTGSGIRAEDQPHVFKRFWQAAPHARAGAGLGLAIARSVVEAHGGRIWVESEPGNGCSFFFTLPTSQPEEQMSSGESGDAARPPWHRDADRYLAAIVESSDDAIFGKTMDGIITSWNRGAERIYGYTAQEAIGQPVSILVPAETENDVPAIMERLRRGDRIEHFETLRRTKDGRSLNISLTISPIYDDDGRIVGASTIARDVTAQVEARRTLEESRWELEELNVELEQTIEELERQSNSAEAEAERMRRLQRITTALAASLEPGQVLEAIIREVIEAADAYAGGVVELSADGRELITVQARGYDAGRLQDYVRLHIDQRLPACDAVRTGEPVFIGSRSELEETYPALDPIHRGDGAWAALPLQARGRVIGALTMTFLHPREFTPPDRTFMLTLAVQCAQALDRAQLYDSERQARREAQEASRAKSNFLAVMSHELRTPLTAILGYGALLEDEIVGPLNERQRDQIQRMRESGRHLLGLIDQILSLSRIEAGREQIDAQSLDAAELLRDVAAMIGPLANRAGLRLELDVPDASAEMRSDAGKIRQILLNLASNAVKFTDRGHVDLRLEVDRDVVTFQVADTGPGISAEDRERIFHPFEQAEQGPTRPKGGTGLGLSVSLELARLLGGDITVESEVGCGSTFTVRLPRVGRHAPPVR